MNGWISVKDKLPDNSALVIVCLAKTTVTAAHYNHGRKHWKQWNGVSDKFILGDGLVTHWKPLPEPPSVPHD